MLDSDALVAAGICLCAPWSKLCKAQRIRPGITSSAGLAAAGVRVVEAPYTVWSERVLPLLAAHASYLASTSCCRSLGVVVSEGWDNATPTLGHAMEAGGIENHPAGTLYAQCTGSYSHLYNSRCTRLLSSPEAFQALACLPEHSLSARGLTIEPVTFIRAAN